MLKVTAYKDVPNPRVERKMANGHYSWRTHFMKPDPNSDADYPQCFLAEGTAGRLLRSHFHFVDQFQVIWNGGGTLGAHPLDFGTVHFSRAYTPYGPIRYSEKGLGFITLRAHRDPGANYMPDKRAELDAVPNRRPWQCTVMPDFSIQPGESGVAMTALEGMQDERGLAVSTPLRWIRLQNALRSPVLPALEDAVLNRWRRLWRIFPLLAWACLIAAFALRWIAR